MKRPRLIRFVAIETREKISIQASVNYLLQTQKEAPVPMESLSLLRSSRFTIKLVGLDKHHEAVFEKVYKSDAYGDFDIKIDSLAIPVSSLQIFEVSKLSGMDLLLGTRIPIKMTYPLKLVICDFDKTLVDTRYSSFREVYRSLSSPIHNFPTVKKSLEIFRGYIKPGFQPFIISASPHFYENSIRDWLYQHHIYTTEIFLKDYRRIFSLLDAVLTPKDVRAQGFYKLNYLVSILLMTGIPDELVLIGDGFESDPLVYLTLASILQEYKEPWNIWNEVKKLKHFHMNRKQDGIFLNKIYQLQSHIQRKGKNPALTIHIRSPEHLEKKEFPIQIFQRQKHLIQYYEDEN